MSSVTRKKTEGVPVFDLDRFKADCSAAASGRAGQQAIREIVARAVEDPRSVRKALGEPSRADVQTLHRSSDLTILNVIWGPRMYGMPSNPESWPYLESTCAPK